VDRFVSRWNARASTAAAVAACLFLTACKQEIAFTRVPPSTASEQTAKPNESTIFLAVPVDLSPVVQAAEQAVGDKIAVARVETTDAACDRRKNAWLECMGAPALTELSRDGSIEVGVEGHSLVLRIPIKYTLNAKGYLWASYLTDNKTGTVTVSVPFDVALGPGYKLDVRMGREFFWSEKTISFLQKGKVSLASLGDAKLRSQLTAAFEPLKQAIANQPIREAVDRAWRALHSPIELSRAPQLWLRSLPERVTGGGFAVEGANAVYRIAIDARIGVHRGERPSALHIKPAPDPARVMPQQQAAHAAKLQQTTLRLPLDVGLEALSRSLAAAFPKSEVIETLADAKAQPLKLRVTGTHLFPSRDRLALELQLAIVHPTRLAGLTGKAYLLARPQLAENNTVIEIADVAFPAAPPIEKPSKDAKELASASIRIGEEPFAGRFARAARLGLGSEITDLLPKLNRLINQRLDERMEITGRFDGVTVSAVEPVRDAFRLHLEFAGRLTLKFGTATAGAPPPSRTN
jgi:hypothetical protein